MGGGGLKYQYFVVAEVVVAGGDDPLARFEAFEHFIELRVLAADAYLAPYGLSSFRSYHIDPFSSCLLVECSAWDQDCAFRLTELEVQIVGLTCPYV